MDLKLSNHVFNALKQHAYSEERRSARLHEKKEHSTAVSNLTFFLFDISFMRLVFQIKDVTKTQVALLFRLFRFNIMVINYLFKTNISVAII